MSSAKTGDMGNFKASHFNSEEIRKHTLEWLRISSPEEVAGAQTLPMDIFWELYKSVQPVGEDWNRIQEVYQTFMTNDSAGVDERLTAFYAAIYEIAHAPGYDHRVADNFLWMKYTDSSFYAAPVPLRSLTVPESFDVMNYNKLYNRITDCLLFPVSEDERIKARKIVDAFISAERGRF